MNMNRFLLASAAAGIFYFFYGYVANVLILGPMFWETIPAGVFRAEGSELVGMIFLSCMLQGLVLGYIFVQNHDGTGVMEGVRFGFLVACFVGATALLTHAIMPIPLMTTIVGVIGDGIGYVGIGAILALIYKPAEASA